MWTNDRHWQFCKDRYSVAKRLQGSGVRAAMNQIFQICLLLPGTGLCAGGVTRDKIEQSVTSVTTRNNICDHVYRTCFPLTFYFEIISNLPKHSKTSYALYQNYQPSTHNHVCFCNIFSFSFIHFLPPSFLLSPSSLPPVSLSTSPFRPPSCSLSFPFLLISSLLSSNAFKKTDAVPPSCPNTSVYISQEQEDFYITVVKLCHLPSPGSLIL